MPLPGTRERKFEAAKAMKQLLSAQDAKFAQDTEESIRQLREIARIAQSAIRRIGDHVQCVIDDRPAFVRLVKFSSKLYMNDLGAFFERCGPANDHYINLKALTQSELAEQDIDKCLDQLIKLQTAAASRGEKELKQRAIKRARTQQRLAKLADSIAAEDVVGATN